MTASTRHDIHAAAHQSFDPADYKLVGVLDLDTSLFRADDSRGRRAVEAREAEGHPYVEVHPYGQCDACGQHLRYVAVLFHHPSAALVQVGLDCLSGRFAMAKDEVKAMMAQAKAAREAHKLLDGFLAACDEHQDLAYATYARNIRVAAPEGANLWGVSILADIAGKARQYGGDVSAKQIAFLGRILAQLDERFVEQEIVNARRAAEREAAGPAPEGRVEVEGEIVKVAEKAGDWGLRTTITVKLGNGALVNGTAPRQIVEDAAKGVRVAFTATFAPSKGDGPVQAFFSRPVNARLA